MDKFERWLSEHGGDVAHSIGMSALAIVVAFSFVLLIMVIRS